MNYSYLHKMIAAALRCISRVDPDFDLKNNLQTGGYVGIRDQTWSYNLETSQS